MCLNLQVTTTITPIAWPVYQNRNIHTVTLAISVEQPILKFQILRGLQFESLKQQGMKIILVSDIFLNISTIFFKGTWPSDSNPKISSTGSCINYIYSEFRQTFKKFRKHIKIILKTHCTFTLIQSSGANLKCFSWTVLKTLSVWTQYFMYIQNVCNCDL